MWKLANWYLRPVFLINEFYYRIRSVAARHPLCPTWFIYFVNLRPAHNTLQRVCLTALYRYGTLLARVNQPPFELVEILFPLPLLLAHIWKHCDAHSSLDICTLQTLLYKERILYTRKEISRVFFFIFFPALSSCILS